MNRNRSTSHEDEVKEGPLAHVVLVAPDIPWNTGNVGRTCLATQAQLHLVRPLGFSLAEHQLRRAGVDYWQHVAPRLWPSWTDLESELPNLGQPFFFSGEAERDLWSCELPPSPVLVFGRESVGLPPEIRERYRQRLVAIPMPGDKVRSLNLSTSVAIALYETLRQRTLRQ